MNYVQHTAHANAARDLIIASTGFDAKDNRVVCRVSLDHLVRPRQHIRRNREADLLASFEIDHQFTTRPLLQQQMSWFNALNRRATPQSPGFFKRRRLAQ